MKYFYISKEELLRKNIQKRNDTYTTISNCVSLNNHKYFADTMSSSFGGQYPVDDILSDARQLGASLQRFLILKNGAGCVACSRYLLFQNSNNENYIILCDLGVKRKYQGMGYGKLMFMKRLSYIIENEKFDHIFSEIDDNNHRSINISLKYDLKEVINMDFLKQFPEVK